MESIIEEDENHLCPQGLERQPEGTNLLKESITIKASSVSKKDLRQKSGSDGSSINLQLKNENEQLSTMQTSSGFSTTKRSPREPSFESNNVRVGSDARLRPQLISSQNYKSLYQLRSTDRENIASFRPLPGANLTSNGFNRIIEEEEFAY